MMRMVQMAAACLLALGVLVLTAEAADKKDKAAAQALLKPTFALIDHSIHKGILHSNAAARYKSRLSVRFNALA